MALVFPHDIVKEDVRHIQICAAEEFRSLSGGHVLLTGAGGFLGYYLILSILDWNDKHPKSSIKLTALSRFRSGVPEWLKNLGHRKDFSIISSDITKNSFRGTYEYIIHAASFASPIMYRKYPIETMNANVLGLYALLDNLVKRNNKKKALKNLLYFSSSEIYGDPTNGNIPTPETYRGNVSCTGPRACYDESKRFCETLCVNYVRIHALPLAIARPFNNYGPGMKITDGRVIADFARNIIHNEDIVIYSNGSPSRTFCYIADAIIGYIKILARGRAGEAYNIGVSEPEITVSTLAKKMVRIGKKHFQYTGIVKQSVSAEREYLTDNPQRRCPSIAKAKRELRYNPSITLEDGLYRSLLWYKAVYGKP